ncbi:hypothetical protein B0H14DRAFT_550727 [Mycena olivaceomarginata]|nr:hypothetical protein B0H14DRAFT_550727 [Mycena olivaceomarginata]
MGCFAPEPVLQRASTTSSRSLYARGAHIPYSSSYVSPLLQGPAESCQQHPHGTRWDNRNCFRGLSLAARCTADSVCASRTGGSSPSVARCTLHTGPSAAASLGACYVAAGWYAGPRGRLRESDGAILEPVRVAAARSVRTAEVLTYLAQHWRAVACLHSNVISTNSGACMGGVGRIPRLKEGKRRESLLKASINDVPFAQNFQSTSWNYID